MAGTALTLRANSGRTATNGEKVRLSAGGNMHSACRAVRIALS
ncbi:hypothetical protein [Verminephrobacter aporrectodeae]|nr:hypothetical protein [Verminephrobacter aporrectodeae]